MPESTISCYASRVKNYLLAAILFIVVPNLFAQSDTAGALPTDPNALLAMAAPYYDYLSPDMKPWHMRYHYAPARVVSGDYCDVFESKDGLVFLLGDVSGKGIAASMLMSHLHATFRSLADADLPLDKMVGVANRIFAESTMAGQFVKVATIGCARHRPKRRLPLRPRRSSRVPT